jgi:hypothetical protein
MSWYGDRDHKTLVCDYCGDDKPPAPWSFDADGVLSFCSDECRRELDAEDRPALGGLIR